MPRRARTPNGQPAKAANAPLDPARIMSQRELSRVIGKSVHTVIAMRKAGALPRRRIIGGIKGYLYSDVLMALKRAPQEGA